MEISCRDMSREHRRCLAQGAKDILSIDADQSPYSILSLQTKNQLVNCWSSLISTHIIKKLSHCLGQLCPQSRVHPCPPHPPQYLSPMLWVVSHHVEGQPGGEPLFNSCLLPGGESAVQVSGHHQVHHRIQDGDESPQHSEQGGDIAQLRQAVNWTEIQTRALLW